ncbi:hypothetical protein M0R45_035793 [Rubus argutus]|uniref:Protein kinase domain-containing protein n=1 Tax=Rubus argutus TaxID=59490 RepID=A0AAW1VX21_RUBAR
MKQGFISSSFYLFSITFFFKVIEACSESQCGDNGLALHLPFHRGHQCGQQYSEWNKATDDEQRMVLVKYFVKRIDYIKQEIQLRNPYNCLLINPLHIPYMNMPHSPFTAVESVFFNITLFRCPAETVIDHYAILVPCLGNTDYRIYALNSEARIGSVPAVENCTKMYDVLSLPSINLTTNYLSGSPFSYDTVLFKWSTPNCSDCEAKGQKCRLQNNSTQSKIECVPLRKPSVKQKLVATGSTLGSFFVLLLAIAIHRFYSWDRNEKEHQLKVKRFLEDYKAFKPGRYSYADIKRITNGFRDKLGEGAYGTVFKGNLSSEFFVAVKVLNNSKGDGEEFVNEVGAMGHIHHVNVVRMVGFCANGYRRALVYEYFPNGSLQDFISSADNKNGFLGWDRLKDISLGIAKGIEYLHQGCELRILHFDIKPHNVLLDQSFTPKISDFGLAKLCSKDQSIVSMTTARGTMGYIAPEVFSRNFGNVSYKSDVYSFGMLLLEIVGGRKNIGPTINNASDIYYPEWIYNLLEGGEDLRVHIGEGGSDATIAKQLAIVGLWCIQWHPVDRPSMKVVVHMLEGRENLTMPPNHFGSTGYTRTNASLPPLRRLNLELEAIAELE